MHSSKKTILVTGGAGFVGSNLIRRLLAEGHRVISLDNYFAGTKNAHVEGAEYREGHTKDIETLVPETPDLLYHLGEYARVEQSVLEPEIVHDLNVVGTTGVLDYWRKRKCKLVYAGSSTKFGDGGAARNTSPYAVSKAANTERVKEIGDREGLPYAITYFYNVYGPGERAGLYGTLIENFKQMYLRGTPLTVVSPGTQLRNFTHVDDIVDGLLIVGEKGAGDEFGLGNENAYAILDIAKLFNTEIMMMPERPGNRMQSGIDISKSKSLGWQPHRSVEKYVEDFLRTHKPGDKIEKRILVFSTTFYPIEGPAERALFSTIQAMPNVEFDIITTAFSPNAHSENLPFQNAKVFRVGRGKKSDKYLLPFLGFQTARKLNKNHRYLFAWAIMASYASLAAMLFKRAASMPVLVTLADHDLSEVSTVKRTLMKQLLSDADQVYGSDAVQEEQAHKLSAKGLVKKSIGIGDAFANAIRFVYSGFLQKDLMNNKEK